MHISLFGPLRVRTEESVLGPHDFGGVKPKELLALLLLARGHPVTKETLADHLWPGQTPKNIAGTLETYISVLRKKLFTDRTTARQVLATTAGAYRFATDQVTLDIDLFDDLVARAEMAGNDQLRLRRQAVDLVQGQLLEDFGHAPWAHAERELYCDRVTRVHVLVSEEMLATSGFTGAITHAEAALKVRPYAEEAYRVLMLANHALGHIESARQAFERCRSIVGDELGHDPTSETADLAGAIDAGVPAPELIDERLGRALAPAAPTSVDRGDRRDPTRQLPFLGRTRELDAIHSHIASSRAGEFRLVLVRGRAGIGRTALVHHLYESVAGVVGCETYAPLDRELPPLPLARCISHALRDGTGVLDAAEYAGAPLLSESVEALEQLRGILTAHAPMVLLLDDLQWADSGTFVALGWLKRTCPDLPVTVVATARDLAFRRARHLDMLDANQEIRLSPLALDDPADCGDIDEAIVEATGGVPGLLVDHWRWINAGGSGPSPSLRESVLRATRGLSGSHAALLQAVCQLPEPFDPFILDDASPVPPGETMTALQELCDLGFLERIDRSFRFQAPLVREVITGTLSATRLNHPSSWPID